ncbi:MAG: hypothetical protein RID81_09960, partial [Sandaracinaceae bacterium]
GPPAGGPPGGAPPGGAPPGGGFGGAPPAGGAPPGGGFGAPPSQPQGGFGAPPSGGAPAGAAGAAPGKKKRNPLIYVAIGCVALMFLGCLGWAVFGLVIPMLTVADAVDEANEAAEAVAEANEAATETGGGGGGGVCGRAVECCEAYVNAVSESMPTVSAETTCAGVRGMQNNPAATAGCESAISGWRQGLVALGRDVPSACAEQ